MNRFEIRAVRCNVCKDVVYSRAPHDCMRCSCGQAFIDGGSAIIGYEKHYGTIRVGGKTTATTVVINTFDSFLETRKMLYEDWNKKENKYGRVER